MIFAKYLEESQRDINAGISDSANIISHMIKYSSPSQAHKQSASWVETILKCNNNLHKTEKKVGKGLTGYRKAVSDAFDSKVLSNVNNILSKDNTGIKISKIPNEYNYEFINNRDNLVQFLLNNVKTKEALKEIEDNGIEIPDEVYRKIDNK